MERINKSISSIKSDNDISSLFRENKLSIVNNERKSRSAIKKINKEDSEEKNKLLSYGIISLIGNTPLVKMDNITKRNAFNLYAKLEMYNPGQSAKARSALSMISNAWKKGIIDHNTTIIESSSGNLAVAVAQLANLLGFRFICVVDPKTSDNTLKILKAYKADIDMVETPDKISGEYLPTRINRVKELCKKIDNSFWLNQYENIDNPLGYERLMYEITYALNNRVDYLFIAVSTCGTLRGCYNYIEKNNLKTKIIAVDAVGSVIFDNKKHKRLIPGHGAAIAPHFIEKGMYYKHINISDQESIQGCRYLLEKESILAGGSSGAIISAIKKMEKEISSSSNCVAILVDSGERYLDTIYSDEWVEKHFKQSSILSSGNTIKTTIQL